MLLGITVLKIPENLLQKVLIYKKIYIEIYNLFWHQKIQYAISLKTFTQTFIYFYIRCDSFYWYDGRAIKHAKHVKSDCLGQCFFKYNFLTLKLLSVFSGECYVESVENSDKKGESKNATNENCAIR